jgi:hypothetical protein
MKYKVETSEYNDTLCSYQERKIEAEKIYFSESGTLIFFDENDKVVAAFNRNEWKALTKTPG